MELFKSVKIFLIEIQIVLLFATIDTSYGWPATNYSKSADSYGIGALDDEVDWSRHPCKRECKDDGEPLICRYGFTVENYASMSKACYDCPRNLSDCFRAHCVPADGNAKMVNVVNRRLPGPIIEVCQGDRIVVDLSNELMDQTTSIHWHGLHMRGTPFMDGVPMVSQCPIMDGSSFRYDFKTERSGTFWWHGHSGMQRGEGLFGALIVRPAPKQNRVARLYDKDEHQIMLNDWSQVVGTPSYTLLYQLVNRSILPHTILINGLGPYGNESRSKLVPRAVFRVQKGTRYRFRVISAASYNCPMRFKVDGHQLLVISADGADVEPIEVDVIRINSGERYDFVLEANREVDNYWIRITGSNNCAVHQVHQQAILRYEAADQIEPRQPTGYETAFQSDDRVLNPSDRYSESKGALCVSCALNSLEPQDDILAPTPDYQYYLNFDLYNVNHPDYFREKLYDLDQVPRRQLTAQINHLTFKAAGTPMLQSSSNTVGAHQMCNVTEAKCTRSFCACPHILELKLNSSVEIVFVDEAMRDLDPNMFEVAIVHPVHLHGFYFRVLAMEKLNRSTTVEYVKALDQAGKIHRKLKAAPLKDTIDVPRGGYAIVRLRADNPGYWFLHCHIERHMHNGMAMVFKVGEQTDFPPPPKNFPKCSN